MSLDTSPDGALVTLPSPTPSAVRLDPASSALIVMDITDPLCTRRPACLGTVPTIARLLGRCRDAGVQVIHTMGPTQPTAILDAVAPREDEPVLSARADKFHGTELEDLLRARQTTALLLVGTSANGAILYSSFAACLRGFAVAVAADGISADLAVVTQFVLWQLVHQPGMHNPGNDPMAPGRVTITSSDLVGFGRG